MEGNLLTEFGTVFAFSGEMVPQHGEDSYIYSFNERKGLLGVFDGCGGIGSKRYQLMDSKTGAYISARVLGECTAAWFDRYAAYDYAPDMAEPLQKEIEAALQVFKSAAGTSKMKGTMTKSFPATLSITVAEYVGKELWANFIWAGDSRGYILDEDGLMQITMDDIDATIDALDNISDDGVLTNMVSADGGFILHTKTRKLKQKCMIIQATDGCFGYLKTPMEFEYLILYTLMEAQNVLDWKKRLESHIKSYTGDDYTLALAAYGFRDFQSLKQQYQKRAKRVYTQYIEPVETADENKIRTLWQEYKKEYLRGM